jgi:site-specific DNA recombinase
MLTEYRVESNPEFLGKRRVVQEDEATVVRQIFEWAAGGIGVYTIIRRLQESVPGPWRRPWTQGTIRRILQNEVYLGKLIWGRVNYERQPGTNKKVRRLQPPEQWKVIEQPDLRIVSDNLWNRVRDREKVVRAALKGNLARGRLPGHQSKYLFSGFLKCGKCGASIVVVSSGKVAGPRYGCLKAKRQYTCSNDIEMSLKKVETRLLDRLQAELQKPEVADYIVRQTMRRSQEAPASGKKRDAVTKELERERKKLQNLVRALEDGEPSSTVLTAIRTREESIKRLDGQLGAMQPISAPRVAIEPARICQELANLQDLLGGSAERARPVFKKLNLQVRLFPVEREGERPYWRAVATCQLDALTSDVNLYPHPSGRRKGGPTDPGDGAAGPLPTVRRSRERVVLLRYWSLGGHCLHEVRSSIGSKVFSRNRCRRLVHGWLGLHRGHTVRRDAIYVVRIPHGAQ